MIKIYNMHNRKPKEPYDVKVDRSSILGSPYYMADKSQREETINKYADWFYACVHAPAGQRITFHKELDRLKKLHNKYDKLNLFCWCVPKLCHAEVIKKFLDYELNLISKEV